MTREEVTVQGAAGFEPTRFHRNPTLSLHDESRRLKPAAPWILGFDRVPQARMLTEFR